jgi:hypothetical protein
MIDTSMKRNVGGGWSYDDVVLWLVRKKNRDVIEWCGAVGVITNIQCGH